MRQGHSGAGGQGDVTWSLHPHRQSKGGARKCNETFFLWEPKREQRLGENSKSQYGRADRTALGDEVSVWMGQSDGDEAAMMR